MVTPRAKQPGELLTLRSLVYQFLSKIYYQEPDDAFLHLLIQQNLFETFPLPPNREMREGLEQLRTWRRENSEGLSAEGLSALRWDYTRLFVGPGRLPAPPWESVYRSDEGLTFEKQTYAVRRFYRQFGLENVRINREPDDHIGLELEFMHHLCQKAIEALGKGDRHAALEVLEAQREFLENHLLTWVPAFCADVYRSAETLFFKGTAKFTAGFLKLDEQLLGNQGED